MGSHQITREGEMHYCLLLILLISPAFGRPGSTQEYVEELRRILKTEDRALILNTEEKQAKYEEDKEYTEKVRSECKIIYSSPATQFVHKLMYTVAVAPAVWFRENVVEKVRGPEYHWYHRRYRRVPTIDECYFHDWACRFEAQEQMERDKMVEEQICQLLMYRALDCANRERYMAIDQLDPNTRCGELREC